MIRAKVRAWVERYALLPQDGNIVAACSGGPDSLALVAMLDELRHELHFSLFVAHFDHGLRGEASTQDAAFVRHFCTERGLPFFCGDADVRTEALFCGGSIEEVARRLRYNFLFRIAEEVGGALVATGHHRDDQAETVLLNLVRGSGGRGLGAMRPQRDHIIHPFLCLTHAEIETYCREQRLQPRQDDSNSDVEFRRNRVRHELLPFLKRRFSGAVTDTLCRTADILAEEQDFLRSHVERHLPEWAVCGKNGYHLNLGVFSQLHVAVQRTLILNLLEKLRGEAFGISFTHVEQVRTLFLQAEGSRRIDLPGKCQARKSYQDLFVEWTPSGSQSADKKFRGNNAQVITLSCPGETRLTEFGVVLRCKVCADPLPFSERLGPTRVAFDREALSLPLTVRRRLPGDRLHLLGASGSSKLKKVLIDLKIPAEQREMVPIVCDSAGILWVAGYRRSERARLSATTRDYIVIEIVDTDTTH